MREQDLQSFVENPFRTSLIKNVLYHGTTTLFDYFKRLPQGIYVTPSYTWARDHYGSGNVIAIYANITKIKTLTWNDLETDWFYDMNYDKIAPYLKELSMQGYNACLFGGESDSMVLFNNIDIVNAKTGQKM